MGSQWRAFKGLTIIAGPQAPIVVFNKFKPKSQKVTTIEERAVQLLLKKGLSPYYFHTHRSSHKWSYTWGRHFLIYLKYVTLPHTTYRCLKVMKPKTRVAATMEMIEIEVSIDQFSLIDAIELITAGYRDRDWKGRGGAQRETGGGEGSGGLFFVKS